MLFDFLRAWPSMRSKRRWNDHGRDQKLGGGISAFQAVFGAHSTDCGFPAESHFERPEGLDGEIRPLGPSVWVILVTTFSDLYF